MRLEFAGAPEVTVSREEVWARLMDPNFVAASAPGVESVEAVDPTHFKVISGIGVGPMRVSFQLDVELSDVVPPERLRICTQTSACIGLGGGHRLQRALSPWGRAGPA